MALNQLVQAGMGGMRTVSDVFEDVDTGDGTLDDEQVELEFGDLKKIDHTDDDSGASLDIVGDGYVINVDSIDGNTVTASVYESAGSNAEMATVADGTTVTITGMARGY